MVLHKIVCDVKVIKEARSFGICRREYFDKDISVVSEYESNPFGCKIEEPKRQRVTIGFEIIMYVYQKLLKIQ